jgi:nitrite reductase (NADH) small subunit
MAPTQHKFIVALVSEIPPGGRKILEVAGRSIGVFNVNGTFYALKNVCPHQFAPLCEGKIMGTTLPSAPGEYIYGRQGEIIRCPWHGWEFDLTNGKSIFNPHRCRVKAYEVNLETLTQTVDPSVESYPVSVEEARVVVTI